MSNDDAKTQPTRDNDPNNIEKQWRETYAVLESQRE